VKVDGEEAVLHITDQSIMFERGGRVSGFERSAIRMPRPYAEPQWFRLSGTLPDHPERDAPPGPAGGLLEPEDADHERKWAYRIFNALSRCRKSNHLRPKPISSV